MTSKAQPRERMNKWFQPHEGIAREVISADIQRYLGRDALVRPGVNEGQDGYWITAYRNLTTEMVRDLQQDSLRWRAEQQGHSSRRGASDYTESQTHQSRQYYGPSETPAPTMDSQYPPPPVADAYGGREPFGQQPVRTSGGYSVQPGYTQPTGYAPQQGYGHPQSGGFPDGFQSAQPNFTQQTYGAPAANIPYSTQAYPVTSVQHPQYGGPQPGSQYVTSTTPQAYDPNQQVPRSAGYQQPQDTRATTAVDPYAAGYRTGQPAAGQTYSYQPSVQSDSTLDNSYSPSHSSAVPQASSAAQYYPTDQFGRATQPVVEPTTSKRRHEDRHHSGGHRSRR